MSGSVSTARAIHAELGAEGFVRRYGVMTGWRAKRILASRSGWRSATSSKMRCRMREVFDRAMSAASPHGLFSEQVDPDSGERLGNYPQTLTHLSHIEAALALSQGAATVSGQSLKAS